MAWHAYPRKGMPKSIQLHLLHDACMQGVNVTADGYYCGYDDRLRLDTDLDSSKDGVMYTAYSKCNMRPASVDKNICLNLKP